MHPARSIVLFTTLSGFGFGALFYLGLGMPPVTGLSAFLLLVIAAGSAVLGLVASLFHLGHPERAILAFTQWKTSWLSREGWASVAALIATGLYGIGLVFVGTRWPVLGVLTALLSLVTVWCTSMIYTQLKTVPRWNDWTTPVSFMAAALVGGSLIVPGLTSPLVLVAFAAWQVFVWWRGDQRFGAAGHTLGTATGLTGGALKAFEPPHTGTNYLLNEMVYQVARKHAVKLRQIGLLLAGIVPAVVLALDHGPVVQGLALVSHIAGVLTIRWLFFAEAEHVVGLYYGRR
jgi:DMSO reductase anchor subunit